MLELTTKVLSLVAGTFLYCWALVRWFLPRAPSAIPPRLRPLLADRPTPHRLDRHYE